jgi:hypothetical protein
MTRDNHKKNSLLAGRNHAPLSQEDVRRAVNTFLGLDQHVNVRFEESARTIFHVVIAESGEQGAEIIFGPDIYPGRSVVDPNSALGLQSAAAHELTHYYRWKDKTELPDGSMWHLDEALTSLQAILRYSRNLNDQDFLQLVSDAMQRIQLYVQELEVRDRLDSERRLKAAAKESA